MENLDNALNTENRLRDMFLKYVNMIEELRDSNNIEELQKTLNHVINILPSNVTSFSVPIYNEKEPIIVRCERDSTLQKEQQEEWGLSDLIEYSMSIDSNDNYNSVD